MDPVFLLISMPDNSVVIKYCEFDAITAGFFFYNPKMSIGFCTGSQSTNFRSI